MNKYIVGLDIGTTKIACFIGERAANDKIRIVGFGKTPSLGVERGMVRNIDDAAAAIRRAVAEASEMAKYEVEEVYVGIAGQHVKSRPNQGSIMIPDDHSRIRREDIDRLIADQHRMMLSPGEEILHVFPQEYEVDGEPLGIDIDPVGVNGKLLKANFHIVTCNAGGIRNVRDAVFEAGLKIKGVVLEPVASAYAVLDDRDKVAGVTLVDIGGGTTDIALFKEGIIRYTSVLALAGNAVTLAIKDQCRILRNQAESLKQRFGTCLPTSVNQDDIVSIPMTRDREPREISIRTLADIIQNRMQMIFEQVGYEISLSNYREALINGVVLTGGGSRLNGIRDYAELMLGLDCRIGSPDEHIDLQSSVNFEDFSHPMYATGIGLVIYGILEQEDCVEEPEPAVQEPVVEAPEAEEVETVKPEQTQPKSENKKKGLWPKKKTDGKSKTSDGMGGIFDRFINSMFDDQA